MLCEIVNSFLCSLLDYYERVTNSFMLLCRGYGGIHSSGFRDFLLKPELLRAIVDSGFEHPSEGKCSLYICLLVLFSGGPSVFFCALLL